MSPKENASASNYETTNSLRLRRDAFRLRVRVRAALASLTIKVTIVSTIARRNRPHVAG